MSEARKGPDGTMLATLTDLQSRVLAQAKQKAQFLGQQATEANDTYKALLTMATPEGANAFDQETMSFYYVEPPTPEADPEVSGPAIVTDED